MWLEKLNRHATHLEIGGNQWEVLGWSYEQHLRSNVPHRHTYFEACLVGSHGAGTFFNLDDEHALAPHSFFLARPGARHQIINSGAEEMELFWVSFSIPRAGKDELGSLLQAFSNSPLVIAPQQEDLGTLWRTLLAFAQRSSAEATGEVQTVRHLAQSVLLEIARIGAGQTIAASFDTASATPILDSSNHTGLARLGAQYVHDNLERTLTPDEIARHLGVSRRQLTRLFSSYTGVPPATYIERARMDRAAGQLRAGLKPVKEIALSVGYGDVHHFTRVFTRVVGVSPARYRNGETGSRPHPFGQQIQNMGPLV